MGPLGTKENFRLDNMGSWSNHSRVNACCTLKDTAFVMNEPTARNLHQASLYFYWSLGYFSKWKKKHYFWIGPLGRPPLPQQGQEWQKKEPKCTCSGACSVFAAVLWTFFEALVGSGDFKKVAVFSKKTSNRCLALAKLLEDAACAFLSSSTTLQLVAKGEKMKHEEFTLADASFPTDRLSKKKKQPVQAQRQSFGERQLTENGYGTHIIFILNSFIKSKLFVILSLNAAFRRTIPMQVRRSMSTQLAINAQNSIVAILGFFGAGSEFHLHFSSGHPL